MSEARTRLLMLDYDGTLAPFRRRRDQARPLPATLERLRALARTGRNTVAIVSGRPLAELERLVGIPTLTLIGEHGWEEKRPGGERIQHPLPAAAAVALARAQATSLELGWEHRLEHKRTALVLHTRGLPARSARGLASQALKAWAPAARDQALRLDATLGGVELRARGHDKGTAAQSLIDAAPPESLAVYVGDDATDEDAFAVVRDRGLGVRVGLSRRRSLATARLADCRAVAAFLGHWLRVTSA